MVFLQCLAKECQAIYGLMFTTINMFYAFFIAVQLALTYRQDRYNQNIFLVLQNNISSNKEAQV